MNHFILNFHTTSAKCILLFTGSLLFAAQTVSGLNDALLVTEVFGELVPKHTVEIQAQKSGPLTFKKDHATEVFQGELLGFVDKERMDVSAELNELKQIQREAKNSSEFVKEVESIEKLKEDMVNLDKEIHFLEGLLSADIDLSEDEVRVTQAAIKIKKSFLKGFEKSLGIYEDAFNENAFSRLEQLEKILRKEDTDKRLAEFRVLSEGSGHLRWFVSDGAFVSSKDIVAEVTDDSEVFIHVPSEAVDIANRIGLNGDLILVGCTDDSIVADYSHMKRERESIRPQVTLIFKVRASSHSFAAKRVFLQMAFKLFLIPKSDVHTCLVLSLIHI